ncbi:MAG: hypothetical protein B7Z75_07160 [Acidocella sp. 20-57-95]|nr:MAG: hypothetical protein B7Z75_07160 [Acidocella sp. 20-57-95]OYV56022.1 MAG: hypothetical protein B7Z71_12970 [Acidocella sp. 21-58-7]HQT63546.1 hypothetical protein [Acidocella sp.]
MSQDAQWIRVLSTQEARTVAKTLSIGLGLVEDISEKLHKLNNLMLAGKPHEIAEAATVIETALKSAAPAFADITKTMALLGAGTLQDAATQLRKAEQNDAASLADALRHALSRFAKKSVDANRRATQLNRGINSALKSLQALGIQENGRLIAEA